MYDPRYAKTKQETVNLSLAEMEVRLKEMYWQAVEMWQDVPSEMLDTPFYEYMFSDTESSMNCYAACLEEKGKEQELNYYCLRVIK